MHPQFAAPAKKECHFFDKYLKVDTFGRGTATKKTDHVPVMRPRGEPPRTQWISDVALQKYLKLFPVKPINFTGVSLTGDATPAYILSPKSPAMMRRLVPETRLLLILRNPVDRAYSEWNMKARRVDSQLNPSDVSSVNTLVALHITCMQTRGQKEAAAIKQYLMTCLPNALIKSSDKKLYWLGYHKRSLATVVTCTLPWSKNYPNRTRLELERRMRYCLGKTKKESVMPFDVMVRKEMARIRKDCMVPPRDSARDFQSHTFDWHKCWPTGSSSNIVKDFVVRGLYLEQIKDYHASFPDEQVMILSDHDLKTDPATVLNDVFEFVGLPPLVLDQLPSSAELNRMIDAQWPGFEAMSGWHLASKYPPMSKEIRNELAEFYRPHNLRLERYLGRSFGWS